MAIPVVSAQRFPGEWAWNELFEHEGVVFKYIYYKEANAVNDGLVMMLENTNEFAVKYSFKVIFRSEGEEVEAPPSEGVLGPGELKTGQPQGLFWTPFEDGRKIKEVGLRGYKITRIRSPELRSSFMLSNQKKRL